VDALVAQDPARLVVVDDLYLGQRANLEQAEGRCAQLRFHQQDASDAEAMRQILAENQVEVVFNLAVIPLPASLSDPKGATDVNVLITTTLCELAREGCFQTLVHFSSSEAFGTARTLPMAEDHPLDPLTPYAASKAAGDHIVLSYVHTFGIDAAIVRPFNNYGPRQNDKAYAGVIPILIRGVMAGEPLEIFGDGEQTRDFLFVADTAGAAIDVYACAEARGRIVNIASGFELSVNQLVLALLRVMKAEDHPVVHGPERPADVRRHCGDISVARKLLDFQPSVDLEEGLRLTVDWYLRN